MIKIEGDEFVDQHGRTVLLRGINLGGSTKVPTQPNGPTHLHSSIHDQSQTISFVGRPFPEEEADEHFGRLRHWGFNTIRFLVTWEAIEPERPQSYDHKYLDYVSRLIAKAGEYGFYIFIDSHQDVWSRFTGGDGAPAWTLTTVGFDLSRLHITGAAFLHQEVDTYEDMRWVTNYNKLAAATMFTLFFAGNDFAPFTYIGERSIQDYLQWHYINAFRQLASRVKDMPHVIGYDIMNEPHTGYIGIKDFGKDKEFMLKEGPTPTPEQSMLLGAGYPQTKVSNYKKRKNSMGVKKKGSVSINTGGVRAWREGMPDLWQHNQVWKVKEGRRGPEAELQRKDYFAVVNGRDVDFNKDYYEPFLERFANEIRAIHPNAMMFVEPAFRQELPNPNIDNVVNAGHWYDVIALFTRRYLPKVGFDVQKGKVRIAPWRNIDKSFASQLANIKQEGRDVANAPSLLGEFGISYDLDKKKAYEDGNYTSHIDLLDRTFRALDSNTMSGTLWNYTADNNHAHGDNWNQEDLSIYSKDDIADVDLATDWDAGGRAIGAFCRPYAIRTGGTPVNMSFDIKTRTFEYTFKLDNNIMAPTEIYVPDYHYSVGIEVEVTDGKCEYDQDKQLLCYFPSGVQEEHTIRITRQRDIAEVLAEQITADDQSSTVYPLEKSFISTNLVRLHTVQSGPKDGEVVILLHSFPEFWYGWREQIPHLVRQGYRVVVPDLRGTNLSDKPSSEGGYQIERLAGDILGLLDALGCQSAYIAGHGLGGLTAWWLAAKYPSRVKKAAVLNMAHPSVMTEQKQWKKIGKLFPKKPSDPEKTPSRISRLFRRNPKSLATDMISAGLNDTFTDEDWDQYNRAWSMPEAIDHGRLWGKSLAKEKPILYSPRVTVPMLVMWSNSDSVLSRDLAQPSVDYCDDGRVVYFEHASHWLQHDEPDRVNLYLSRFFQA